MFTSPYLGTAYCTGYLVQLSLYECNQFAATYNYPVGSTASVACSDKMGTCSDVVELTGCDAGTEVHRVVDFPG